MYPLKAHQRYYFPWITECTFCIGDIFLHLDTALLAYLCLQVRLAHHVSLLWSLISSVNKMFCSLIMVQCWLSHLNALVLVNLLMAIHVNHKVNAPTYFIICQDHSKTWFQVAQLKGLYHLLKQCSIFSLLRATKYFNFNICIHWGHLFPSILIGGQRQTCCKSHITHTFKSIGSECCNWVHLLSHLWS